MGRSIRPKPNHLAEKLKKIRDSLGLSQNGLLIRLGFQESSINRASISAYELGDREPPLMVLYAYANLANVYMEVLVDDNLELPDFLPSENKNLGKNKNKKILQ